MRFGGTRRIASLQNQHWNLAYVRPSLQQACMYGRVVQLVDIRDTPFCSLSFFPDLLTSSLISAGVPTPS